jgi:hypothetical protein
MNRPRQHFGSKAPTKAELEAALLSLLYTRTKPYSDRDLEGIARTHRTTADKIKGDLRTIGRGALIQADAWERRG